MEVDCPVSDSPDFSSVRASFLASLDQSAREAISGGQLLGPVFHGRSAFGHIQQCRIRRGFHKRTALRNVCRSDTATDLLRQITGPKGEIRPFEALLETTIVGGVPLQTHLVTIRIH